MILKSKRIIAIFVPSLGGGGAERVMVTLANNFADRGFSVDLILGQASGPFLKEVDDRVRIFDLKASRVIKSLGGLVRYLRVEQPVAMLSAMNHANVIAITAHRIARSSAKLLVSERAQTSVALKSSGFLRGKILGWFMKLTYPLANGVIAVSNGVADDLAHTINLNRDRIHVIYNPVVDENLITLSLLPVQHPFFLQGSPPVFLGVGRLVPVKGFVTLILAFERLRKKMPARLIILGEGSQRGELEALIDKLGLKSDVSLPGFVENPYPWMRQSDVFVLSSVSEGLPGALIQAMACGARIVATDCPGGTSEILEKGRWGCLVPVGDVVALANAMQSKLKKTADLAVNRRASNFNINPAVEGYLEALGVLKNP